MIKDETYEYNKKAMLVELDNAITSYGDTYSSIHEFESVLREELDECVEALKEAVHDYEMFYKYMRQNDIYGDEDAVIRIIDNDISHLQAECAQVRAVCHKYLMDITQE